MTYSQSHDALVLALSLLFLSACASQEAVTSGGSTEAAPASSRSSMKAAPPAYDSLQACLARIPSGGTAGTRMLAEEGCRREAALQESIAGSGTTKSGNRAAAGTVGDSLDACMARIPKDSSAGQRMMAEETCKRDQGVRP